jgi:adhesin/invasin
VYLPFVRKAPEALGTVMGKVVDATTVRGIPGAAVCVVATGHCATTDGEGSYAIAGVPAGRRAVRASANGFIALQQGLTVPIGGAVTVNFALSPDLAPGEMRIVLTWGETPQDLDAHLWLPGATPYHIHFASKGDCQAFPDACLDVDDQTGDGPETVTIRQSYAGRYVFAVYNWSNEVPLTQSDGRVLVYRTDGVVAEVPVPTSGDGRWWHVFDLDGATGELTMHNALRTTAPAPYVTKVEGTAK